MNFPFIVKGGKEIKRYLVGSDTLIFIKNPECIGPIKYKFVAMLYLKDQKYPSFFVTSEYSEINILSEPQYFLNIYQNEDRKNLGLIDSPNDFKKFEAKAFIIVNGLMKYDKDTKITIKSNTLSSKIYNTVRYFMLTLLFFMICYGLYLEASF